MIFAKVGDPPDFRQPAASADVRLNDADSPAGKPLEHLPASRRGLCAAYAYPAFLGQARVTGQIIMLKGRLGKEDGALLDAIQDIQCIMPVPPAVAEIDRHQDVVAQHLAALSNETDQLPIRHQIVEQNLHFHGSET
jgi:hypothetical protein